MTYEGEKLVDYLIPIVIPAYEPDNRLIELLKDIISMNIGPVILVDDGSGNDYQDIFDKAKSYIDNSGGIIIRHTENKGKGRALKTAFHYVLSDSLKNVIGVVTADSDGQHTAECIRKIQDKLYENAESLILGVRKFDTDGIPWKSRFGNQITKIVFKYIVGSYITDTQTGLRGIPYGLCKELLDTPGEGFEFEMRMLVEASEKYDIIQEEIETVYDSVDNHVTHFKPFSDSRKIYGVLLGKYFKYIVSSLSSFCIDILLFTFISELMTNCGISVNVVISTILARTISSCYNFCVNYRFVFDSEEKPIKAALKYFILVIIQMIASAIFVVVVCKAININATVVKVFVDTILFLISYVVQRSLVFRDKII